MKFGIFDHLDRGAGSLQSLYADRLALVEAYDRAGFHAYHLAEHHATPLGCAPSPSLFLAALAQRTHKLRFGPLVYILPLYPPLRLIDEVCMLDQMSGGRLELGVGRGISPIEIGFSGLDTATAQAMYAEALEILLQGLATRVLNFQGKYYNFRDVPIVLEPVQAPHPPLWCGIGRPDGVPWAVRNAVNVVANLPAAPTRAITDRYRAEWMALGHSVHDLPLMGMTRHVVVAETEHEALAIARPAYRKWREDFLLLWQQHHVRLPNPAALPAETFDAAEQSGRAIAGTSAKVADSLRRDITDAGVNYLLCRFCFGDMPHDAALRSVQLFARDVMPAFAPGLPDKAPA
jgi:alkanesulfonate monooxygenase SsuD/methylene tetrahydromethanopterin reductase-like flavin-dependent oxidoreductase (luciferase family)